MESGAKTDIYASPAAPRRGENRVRKSSQRRKRRLTTRSQYPAEHREGRRMSRRELRRRIVFWALVACLAGIGGYAYYKSRTFTMGEKPLSPDLKPSGLTIP